ncbi:glycosyltransferase [Sphingomonas sp. Leaf4]|uniref:glycosyltransferase n=1 Tax=Sphingomonas sp. Leaf4 TaxID=2876553 RepID=UPI001E2A8E68|nr:glycosyltransferase [Sphingomonas sp. Leaf4]
MTPPPARAANAARPTADDVVVGIVTYGARRTMLLAVLERLREERAGRVVVVDNGAHWPVADDLAAQFGDWIDVVPMGANMGSAAGFVTAFEAALRTDRSFVWILDDDNRPHAGCLAALLAAHAEEAMQTPRDLLAVVAMRAEHFAGHVSAKQLMTRWNSFSGFHVADLVSKVLHRLPGRKQALQGRVQLGVTHFGGMLLHRALIERIGLPRRDFFMYGDDTELTWRITAGGGRIVQVADALVEDLEGSFQQTSHVRNRFIGALLSDSDFRTYYSVRNLAYFESRFRCSRRMMFTLNRRLYFAILHRYARRLNRMERYHFIRASADEGLGGRLGPDNRFPLR